MNFLLSIIRRCPLLPIILKILNNERGQTPSVATSTQGVDPALAQFLLSARKPATGLLGEGAFSALGADPNQFATMSGLPMMAGEQNLFRINPAEAEQLSLGESKARENILNNTPMRGGELNQGLAQNIMHYGGLRQKLTEDRRNQALNALGGLGMNVPVGFSGSSQATGPTGPSTGSQLLSALGGLGVQALNPLIQSGVGQLTGLLGLGGGSNPFAGQTASLAGMGWDNANLLSPIDTTSAFPDLTFSMPDPWSSFLGGFF